MSPVLEMVLAGLAGIFVGVITQVARRKGTVAWRATAALLGLVGVGVLFLARTGDSVMPLALFTVVLVVSYAWQPREEHPAD